MRRPLVALFAAAGVIGAGSIALAADNYQATLRGANEIPARDTRARGNAVFHLSKDGTELEYRLVVSNIENLVQAHIHIRPPDNGPVVAFLFGPVAPGGGEARNGPIATGTITASDLIGPLAGQPLSALVAQIEAGNAYVNVHTDDGIAPINTGAGDFPMGEIRGDMD